MALEVYDTITITKTITVDRNETGDTLRLTQVTDRYRGHDALKLRDKSEKIKVVHDTVYVEKRDSVDVKESRMAGSGNQGGKTALHGTLKWIFYIILGLIALVITVRVCLRKW